MVLRAGLSLFSSRVKLMLMKEVAPHITVDEKVAFGKPVIAGTRIHVEIVLGHLAAGMTADEVAQEYGITRDDVLACLAYATEMVKGERIRALP